MQTVPAVADETKFRVRLERDSDPMSPRDWENVGTMACWHSRYNLGDEQPTWQADVWLRDLAAEHVKAYDVNLISDENIQRILDKHFLILPLYLFDHSGISISCAPFSCPWDSGQVGYIYCTKEEGLHECRSEETALKCLETEVETYDQYLRGDIWGFIVEKWVGCAECGRGEWEEVDSCWGFYGTNVEENGMLDHIDDAYHQMAIEAGRAA